MPIKSTYDELEKIKFESEQVAQKLRNAEFLFSQMFEQSTISMCLYTPEGTIVRANHEFCKMFGVKENEIVNAGYNVFKDQAAIDAGIIPLLKNIFKKKKTENWEIEYNIDSASESTETPTSRVGKIVLKANGYPVLNYQGEIEYVVLEHYDITERKLTGGGASEERGKVSLGVPYES